jgi:WS/DGAT/MGAT family acyltransferase
MSNVDAAWLHMDRPSNLMMVTGVILFDGEVPFEKLREVVETRLLRFERFRQKAVDPGLPFTGPYWEADLDFDLDWHLVRERLDEPADQSALRRRVGELMSTPLDSRRPMWRMNVLEGYSRGSAVVCRFHHCIADGIALIYVILSMTEGDERDKLGVTAPTPRSDVVNVDRSADATVERMFRGLSRAVGNTWQRAGNVIEEGVGLFSDPHKTVDLAALAFSGVGSLKKFLTIEEDSPTSLKGELGRHKVCAWSEPYPLPRIKEMSRVLGGTINDVLITAAAGALRRYLVGRGESVRGVDLRALVPVNLRPLEQAAELGNHFGLIFLGLAAGIEDPFERFHEMKSRMDEIKRSPDALVAFQILRALGLVPRSGTQPLVDLFASKGSLVLTNVPGPRRPVYLAGAKVRRSLFWVPRSGGLGLGLSILSYAGEVTIGIAADQGLVPEPQALADGFNGELRALDELVEMPKRDELEG